jgi:hypothetical protein
MVELKEQLIYASKREERLWNPIKKMPSYMNLCREDEKI